MNKSQIDGPESLLAQLIEAGAASGVVIEMLAPGRRISAAAGQARPGAPMEPDTQFLVGSAIQTMVAGLTLEMASAGEIDLAASWSDYLPELARHSQVSRNVTVRHLLSHTGGFSDASKDVFARAGEFSEFFLKSRQLFEPGSVWSLSYYGYALLAEIIARVSGRMTDDLLDERFFSPLRQIGVGQVAQGHMPAHDKIKPWRPLGMAGAGTLSGAMSDRTWSAQQMIAVARHLMHGEPGPFGKPFPPALRHAMSQKAVSIPSTSGGNSSVTPSAFGLGVANFAGAMGWNGAATGMVTAVRHDISSGATVAVAMNSASGRPCNALARELFTVVRGRRTAARPTRGTVPFSPDRLIGVYEGLAPVENLTVEHFGETFGLRLGRATPVPFMVDNEGRLDVPASIHMSFGIFKDPATGEPGLLVGDTAFRKIRQVG